MVQNFKKATKFFKNLVKMWRTNIGRKGIPIIVLVFLSFNIIASSIGVSKAWTGSDLTSNPGTAPTIDGIKDDSWSDNDVNNSYHEFSGGRRISLFVQHQGNYIYFLIEVKFIPNGNSETISIYLAENEADSENFLDKKQITMINSTQKGNESSSSLDLYEKTTGSYVADENDDFEGAAAIGSVYRYYEFKIEVNPTNASQDATITFSKKHAIKIGLNTTSSDEVITPMLLIQAGPANTISAGYEGGEFQFNDELYIRIVLYISLTIVLTFGLVVIFSRNKIGNLEELKKLEDKIAEDESAKDTEEVEEKKLKTPPKSKKKSSASKGKKK
jgi:hypothetical protein